MSNPRKQSESLGGGVLKHICLMTRTVAKDCQNHTLLEDHCNLAQKSTSKPRLSSSVKRNELKRGHAYQHQDFVILYSYFRIETSFITRFFFKHFLTPM
jgi:hypothetical protein